MTTSSYTPKGMKMVGVTEETEVPAGRADWLERDDRTAAYVGAPSGFLTAGLPVVIVVPFSDPRWH